MIQENAEEEEREKREDLKERVIRAIAKMGSKPRMNLPIMLLVWI